jgi:hypothetical protein
MKISKRIGAGLAVIALGTIVAFACNDSTSGSCTSACNHVLSCIYAAEEAVLADAGINYPLPDAGSFCQDSCTSADGGFAATSCKDPGAGYDCINGLSCSDILGSGNGQSAALLACQQKAQCPDAG